MSEEAVIDFTEPTDRERAVRLILSKGRMYKIGQGGKHRSLHVFTTSQEAAQSLEQAFGGKAYPNNNRHLWQIANKDGLLAVRDAILQHVVDLTPTAQKRLALLLEMSATEAESSDELVVT